MTFTLTPNKVELFESNFFRGVGGGGQLSGTSLISIKLYTIVKESIKSRLKV